MPSNTPLDDHAVFAAPPSFMGVPFSHQPRGSKAAILGVPFDCGTHAVRIGSRLGPNAIREQSALVRPYEPPLQDFNPLERLALVDCGNVRVVPGDIGVSYAAVARIVAAGAVPVTMGGDGAVTLPQLRALHRKYSDLVVLHIDAHTDTYPVEGYNTATTFTRAAEEGLLDAAHSLHIGARGPVYMPEVFEHTRQHGYRLISGVDLLARGIPSVLEEVHATLAGRPVYLCFDMDFFDPSCAPGVCTPAWGGASAREGLALLQGLAGLDLVACDINTVSPPHDVGGMTAFLAATVMLECLFLICRSLGEFPRAREQS
jgi:agmatinase